MVAALPLAKLGYLLIRQISKPIANAVKEQAKSSPVFRKYVCLPPAQFYNWCEVQMKMWILQLGKPVQITVLSEESAIELGANILGEGLIFGIAAALLISEYNRSSNKEAAKEEAKRQEIANLQNTIMHLFMQSEEHGAQIRELTRRMSDLESRVIQKPWVQRKPEETQQPIKPPPSPPPFFNQPFPARTDAEPPETESGETEDEPNLVSNVVANRSIITQASNEVDVSFLGAKPQKNKLKREGLLIDALNQLFYEDHRLGLKL